MTAIEALKQQPLFSWISNAPLEYLVQNAETHSLSNGDVLYKAGTLGEAIYLILEGNIEFTSDSVPTKTLNTGALFGECSVIELKDRPCEARAKGDASVLVLDHNTLYQFSEKFPDPYSIVVTNLARCLAARIRNLNVKKATTKVEKRKEEPTK